MGCAAVGLIAASDFIERWYKQLFVRCLPWPTTLRVIDAVVSEGEWSRTLESDGQLMLRPSVPVHRCADYLDALEGPAGRAAKEEGGDPGILA